MLRFTITDTQEIEPVSYDWGAVKWVSNNEVAPGCEQSFGLVHILSGKTNPLHWHTAAEELVYVLSGECDIKFDDTWYRLAPGRTLYIPPGVKHELKNNGWEPIIYVASFSASMRGTLFDDPDAIGARPTASGYR
jgi:quercetin dioxygenase-like cupin family protein